MIILSNLIYHLNAAWFAFRTGWTVVFAEVKSCIFYFIRDIGNEVANKQEFF